MHAPDARSFLRRHAWHRRAVDSGDGFQGGGRRGRPGHGSGGHSAASTITPPIRPPTRRRHARGAEGGRADSQIGKRRRRERDGQFASRPVGGNPAYRAPATDRAHENRDRIHRPWFIPELRGGLPVRHPVQHSGSPGHPSPSARTIHTSTATAST